MFFRKILYTNRDNCFESTHVDLMQQGSSLKLKSLGQKILDSSLFRDVLISGYHFYTNAPKSNTKIKLSQIPGISNPE